MNPICDTTIKSLARIRHDLDSLQPNDPEELIRIGSSLEALLNEVPDDDEFVSAAVVLCLQALQAVFEGESGDFGSLVAAISVTLASLEQGNESPASPVIGEMRQNSVAELRDQFDRPGSPLQSKLSKNNMLASVDDVVRALIPLGPGDTIALGALRELLKKIAANEPSTAIRELVTEAASEIHCLASGKVADAASKFDSIVHLIDKSREPIKKEFDGGKEHTSIQSAKTNSTKQEIEPPVGDSVPGQLVRDFTPDTLAADCDLSLVSEFVVESRELLENAERALLGLEFDAENIENVNEVFRAFHTIKGTAPYLGLARLAELAHFAEFLLGRMRDREIQCTGSYADLAFRAADMLKEMLTVVEELLSGHPGRLPDGYLDLFRTLSAQPGSERRIYKTDPNREVRSAEAIIAAPIADTVTSEAGVDKRLFKERANDSSVRVRTDRLDKLIDFVGELVIAQSMLIQDATVMQGGYPDLTRKISHAGKIVRELQDLSMGMRMIPFRSTFQKLTRLVRDLAQKCGKQIEFVTEGEDTEIDRNMVDLIGDPLVHMVRNAVDHGIEKPDQREASGKSRGGKIMLAAYHSGGEVVVELRDDGAGIDPEVIVAKAIQKGLIESDKGLSEDQVFNLILAPGFSTAETVTNVSGRGVGMDVVRRNIESMRGRISIVSEKTIGSTFTIRLPLTLAITDGMLVRVGVERFIIPIVSIHLSFQPNKEMVSKVAGRGELVSLNGELMPVFRLHRLFKVRDAVLDPTQGILMVVSDGRQRCALLVDELLGQQHVVAKSLGHGMGKIPGVTGGAILGDGCIGLILDTPELVALARQKSEADVDEMSLQLQAA